MANLPADLPTNWTQGQTISPNGTEVGLTKQHGYNYLNQQVNATQTEVNNLSAEVAGAASQTSVDNIASTIGTTTDSGATSTTGTLMGKVNAVLEKPVEPVYSETIVGRILGATSESNAFTLNGAGIIHLWETSDSSGNKNIFVKVDNGDFSPSSGYVSFANGSIFILFRTSVSIYFNGDVSTVNYLAQLQ